MPADPPQPPPTVPGGVDARFTLAAERTVLAWMRTALGFLAGGVAVVFIAPGSEHAVFEAIAGLAMVATGAGIALTGAYRWRRTTVVLHSGGQMPGPTSVFIVVGAIVVAAILLAVIILISL